MKKRCVAHGNGAGFTAVAPQLIENGTADDLRPFDGVAIGKMLKAGDGLFWELLEGGEVLRPFDRKEVLAKIDELWGIYGELAGGEG